MLSKIKRRLSNVPAEDLKLTIVDSGSIPTLTASSPSILPDGDCTVFGGLLISPFDDLFASSASDKSTRHHKDSVTERLTSGRRQSLAIDIRRSEKLVKRGLESRRSSFPHSSTSWSDSVDPCSSPSSSPSTVITGSLPISCPLSAPADNSSSEDFGRFSALTPPVTFSSSYPISSCAVKDLQSATMPARLDEGIRRKFAGTNIPSPRGTLGNTKYNSNVTNEANRFGFVFRLSKDSNNKNNFCNKCRTIHSPSQSGCLDNSNSSINNNNKSNNANNNNNNITTTSNTTQNMNNRRRKAGIIFPIRTSTSSLIPVITGSGSKRSSAQGSPHMEM
ncbi:uncharacterized protein DDB_G0288805-like [Macrobrachium rosenbergii]|uniref:uncharacterized protein DDB_G0288805-like n=1 Tax=Macrobrachium rosenbergii TaxID=79674 RepID=UPI0034D50CCC